MQQPPRVLVAGVGMTRFVKPGSSDYPDLAQLAITRALADAHLAYADVQSVLCGYVYGDSTSGQRAVYSVGLSGVPIVNVNNNCSTGSSALYLGRQAILADQADCVLVVGFEKMAPGSLSSVFNDRANPLSPHIDAMASEYEYTSAPFAAQLFGNAGRAHMKKYGTTDEQIAKIAVKNHKHSVNNPYAQFRTQYSLEQVLKSPPVHAPLTKLQCCPTSDGAAAVILVSEAFAMARGLSDECVEIAAMAVSTDREDSFKNASAMHIVGYGLTERAGREAYRQAAITPDQIQVAEVHDCFSTNELITYEALSFCPAGQAGTFIGHDAFTYGGKVVVNPSGGLISKGHPLGATGLAQCTELVWQLRGHAAQRQVTGAKYALQHNLGLGGACVVAIYKKFTGRPAIRSLTSDPTYLEAWETQGRPAESRPYASDSRSMSKL